MKPAALALCLVWLAGGALAQADLSGNIGYRAGPPEGYGPGVWFYEPAGARHEATQRVGEEDLIYEECVEAISDFSVNRLSGGEVFKL